MIWHEGMAWGDPFGFGAVDLRHGPGAAAGGPRPEQAETLAARLVGRMTTDEKLGQLLNTAPAIPRLEVPAYNWWTESLHGALGPCRRPTSPSRSGWPRPSTTRWSDARHRRSRRGARLHALARTTGRMGRIGTGLDTWSPNINIFRDPRWGRGQETYGEDPFLTARMGVAFVRGMQGDDPNRSMSSPRPNIMRCTAARNRPGTKPMSMSRSTIWSTPICPPFAPRSSRAGPDRSCAPITGSTASPPAPATCC